MGKYSCEKCAKTFSQKSHYDKHISRKNPCEIQIDKIKALIDKAVDDKLIDLHIKLKLNNNENNITINIAEQMDISKMSKLELLKKCEELGNTRCSSKNKAQLIEVINSNNKTNNNTEEYKNVLINQDVINKTTTSLIEHISENVVITENAPTTINLFKGDCLIEMAKIKSGSIDMILCDLPYGITKNEWDIIIPFDKLWEHYNRIIKDNGAVVLFGSQPFTSLMITSNLKNFRYCLVWEKNKFSDFLNAKRKPMKTNEDIAIFYKKQPTYNPQYWYSTPYTRWNTQLAVDKQTNYGNHKENFVESLDGKRLPTTVLKFNRIERPKHPTQKPIDLLEWLIKTYSNEGEVVLDNCMGVGSTGVACKNLKRSFIGIELNDVYFDIANESIHS
jgi:site-specific DNA-methyltransferase (adenine-specific)